MRILPAYHQTSYNKVLVYLRNSLDLLGRFSVYNCISSSDLFKKQSNFGLKNLLCNSCLLTTKILITDFCPFVGEWLGQSLQQY